MTVFERILFYYTLDFYVRPITRSDLLMGSNNDSSLACRPAGSTRRYFEGSEEWAKIGMIQNEIYFSSGRGRKCSATYFSKNYHVS